MLNVAICSDEEGFISEVDISLNGLKEKHKKQISVYCFNCVEDMLQMAASMRFDYVFLDIRLEKENFEIAQELALCNHEMRLFFLSDNEEYEFELFTFNPLGLVRRSKLRQDMEQIADVMDKSISGNRITYDIFVGRNKISIYVEEIMYIESQRNYMIFYMQNGEVYKTRMTMKQFMLSIDNLMFYRINDGCVINLKYLQKIEKRRVYLTGGMNFSIGRKIYPEFHKYYDDFSRTLTSRLTKIK